MEMMEDVTIPGWFLGAILIIWLPWMLYLTKGMNDNQRAIDINNSNDKNVSAELKRIYHLIEKIETKLDGLLAHDFNFIKKMLMADKKKEANED